LQILSRGARRLEAQIQEEEYRRICDALSNAPASMIVFDGDKRAVFVSDHYFRAYPKIAPRLIRGLSVYDTFDMMMREEGITREDSRYLDLRNFWHNLEGSIEFVLDNGTYYRLKAVKLPNHRGTVVTGQSISDTQRKHVKMEEKSSHLSNQLKMAMQDHEARLTLIRALPRELDGAVKHVRDNLNKLQVLLISTNNPTIERSFRELSESAETLKSLSEKLDKLAR
jgi:hypothetical protein